MNIIRHGFILIALWSGSACAQSVPQDPPLSSSQESAKPSEKITLDGIIKEAHGTPPEAGTSLTLVGPGGRKEVTADNDGQFHFSDLIPGVYRLAAHGDFGEVLGHRSLALDASGTHVRTELAIQRSGTISGRVLDSEGIPLPKMQVVLVSLQYGFKANAVLAEPQSLAVSDVNGRFLLRGVRPGLEYAVFARPPRGAAGGPISHEPELAEDRKPMLVESWYPSVADPDQAIPIVLIPGEQRESVDIRMQEAVARCVEGVLQAPEGPAKLDYKLIDSRGAQIEAGSTGSDGRFRFCRPETSQYRIVSFRVPTAGAPLVATQTIEAGDKDIIGLKIPLGLGDDVSVGLEWDIESPSLEGGPKLSAYATPVTRPALPFEYAARAQSGVPGTLTISSLTPESYSLSFKNLPPRSYVKQLTAGGQDILHGPLRVGESAAQSVRTVLARNGGTVMAVVSDEDGKAVPDVFVIATPADLPTTESSMVDRLVVGITGADGAYASEALPPGRYVVFATTRTVDLNRETIRRLWRARASAKTVEVGANGTALVRLTAVNLD
jgi:hypothetical protein